MRLGEADRIVTFVGRGQGKIRAVAKGVRKAKGRFGGRLEPFTQVSLVMWRGRSDLDIVTQAEAVESFRGVRENLERFALGQVMLEAVDRVVQEKEPSPRVFNLLLEGLRGLGASGSPLVLAWFLLRLSAVGRVAPPLRDCTPSRAPAGRVSPGPGRGLGASGSPLVLAWFLLRLSAVAGFAPSLSDCTECGAPAAWFSPGQGGAVCGGCRSPQAVEVRPGVMKLLHDLVVEGAWMKTDPEVVAAASGLAPSYAEYPP